jgi:hypothetical protein
LRARLFKVFVPKCLIKYQDREKLLVKSKLTVMALDVQTFDGSPLEEAPRIIPRSARDDADGSSKGRYL